MKKIGAFFVILTLFSSCVSSKKYKDLLAQQKECNAELQKYQASSLDFESKYKDASTQYDLAKAEVEQLKADTTKLGNQIRFSHAQYNKAMNQVVDLEKQLDASKQMGRQTTTSLQQQLDAKSDELQRKQDLLNGMEEELRQKEQQLAEREKRVYELEEMLNRKDKALESLKSRVMNALKPYVEKGLSVEEKDGKLYVRLEAKLLFNTGSTDVDGEGKQALIDLAKLLENEKDLEIIVEGHTDTDLLKSYRHPKDNWELSVLRATSVVEIMLNNSKMDPHLLTAAGRSEYFPVDPNDKSKNRRIEIIIAPNLKALFDLIKK